MGVVSTTGVSGVYVRECLEVCLVCSQEGVSVCQECVSGCV